MEIKELQKLSRKDLLEMLIEQSEELLQTKARLQELEDQIADRNIRIDKAGSIAEAALSLNGLFEAAEAAGQQYLDNIKMLSQRQEQVCERLEKKSLEIAKQRVAETREKCEALEAETKVKCYQMTARAKVESKRYWNEVYAKLEKFYDDHAGLKELLSMDAEKRISDD